MGWEKGKYYTRSRKINGKVVREYIGQGVEAELAAWEDSVKRREREVEQAARKAKKEELSELETLMKELNDEVDSLIPAVLAVAGYHQHKGQWRKKRGQSSD